MTVTKFYAGWLSQRAAPDFGETEYKLLSALEESLIHTESSNIAEVALKVEFSIALNDDGDTVSGELLKSIQADLTRLGGMSGMAQAA